MSNFNHTTESHPEKQADSRDTDPWQKAPTRLPADTEAAPGKGEDKAAHSLDERRNRQSGPGAPGVRVVPSRHAPKPDVDPVRTEAGDDDDDDDGTRH